MPNIIGDIAIQVGADIGPLVTNLGTARGAVNSFGNSATAAASGGMRVWNAASVAMASASAFAGLGIFVMTKRLLDNIDSLSKSASTLGIHTASLQAMSQVAVEAGVSQEQFAGSLVKMQNAVSGLSSGTAAQVTAFGKLGLSMTDLVGKGADEQFKMIAEAIQGIADPTERTASAMDIFGKSGADLIPMFDQYATALADVTQYQKDFNIAVSDEGGKAVEAANDAMGRLTLAATGLGNQLVVTFSPALVVAVVAMTESLQGWVLIFRAAKDAVDGMTPAEEKISKIGDAIAFAGDNADWASQDLYQLASRLDEVADADKVRKLRDLADNMLTLKNSFIAGGMTPDEYARRFDILTTAVKDLIVQFGIVDGVDFSEAIDAMNSYGAEIFKALGFARELAGTDTTGPPIVVNRPDAGGSNEFVSPLAPRTSNAPPTAPFELGVAGPGGSGGGSGGNLEADLQAMRDAFATEAQLADEQFAEKLAKIEEFRQAKLLKDGEYDELELRAQQEHHDAMAQIDAAELQLKLGAVSGALGDVASLMSSGNKRLFEIGKAAALAQGVVDGYSAASSAWTKGMAIGGPPVAAAFTAASLLKTGALLAGIRGASATGSGGGAGGGSGTGSGGTGGGMSGAPQGPLQASLSLVGSGDFIRKADLGSLLEMLSKEAGDRGYQLMVRS